MPSIERAASRLTPRRRISLDLARVHNCRSIGVFDRRTLIGQHSCCVPEPAPPIGLDPVTIIESDGAWVIALNRNQNLLGKTMLVLTRPCASVTDLSAEEWYDLHLQIGRICAAIDSLFAPDLYNYAFLMNRDRQVHLHVVPRYEMERMWAGATFTDQHWGSLFGNEERLLKADALGELADEIRSRLVPD
jgi:diadenosine tetraphosphate (Ap4A) HIT family hydrolase